MHRVTKAVIPAAGLGTRSLPASKAVPKEMLPIVDTPAIQLVVEEALAAGIRDIVLITGRGKGAIEDHFDHAVELELALESRGRGDALETVRRPAERANLIAIRQKRPLGLGHAVLCARPAIGDQPFAVLLPDDLVDNPAESGIAQVCRAYQTSGCSAVAILEVPEGSQQSYGIVAGPTDEHGLIAIDTMVEKPRPEDAPSRLAVIGRYCLGPEIWPVLERTGEGHGGEIQLTDALRELAAAGRMRGVPLVGSRHDTGSALGFLEANLHYALKRDDLRGPLLAKLDQIVADRGRDDD